MCTSSSIQVEQPKEAQESAIHSKIDEILRLTHGPELSDRLEQLQALVNHQEKAHRQRIQEQNAKILALEQCNSALALKMQKHVKQKKQLKAAVQQLQARHEKQSQIVSELETAVQIQQHEYQLLQQVNNHRQRSGTEDSQTTIRKTDSEDNASIATSNTTLSEEPTLVLSAQPTKTLDEYTLEFHKNARLGLRIDTTPACHAGLQHALDPAVWNPFGSKHFFCVTGYGEFDEHHDRQPAVGARIVAINGRPVDAHQSLDQFLNMLRKIGRQGDYSVTFRE